MADTRAPLQVPVSPRPFYPIPPTPGSPRSQFAHGPRTPLSPSFRGPLTTPRTPLSPRGLYGQEPQTPHGFVPMRRDSLAPFDSRTPMSATFKEEEEVIKAEEEVTRIDHADLVCSHCFAIVYAALT